MIRRLDLHGATADLVRSVLTSAGGHRLQALLIAVFSVVLFGLGIGRALQLVYARAWGLEPHGHMVWDQARYLGWFFAFLGLIVLLILQLAYLPTDWVQWALAPVWALILVAFFVWTARFLLHHRVSGREVLPGAILVALGLLVVRLLSSVVLRNWLDWYSTYYGGLGVIMAIFFWILIAPASWWPARRCRRPTPSGHARSGPAGRGPRRRVRARPAPAEGSPLASTDSSLLVAGICRHGVAGGETRLSPSRIARDGRRGRSLRPRGGQARRAARPGPAPWRRRT